MIEVNNITKKFFLPKSLKETLFSPFKKNKEIIALSNVSLKLEQGKILALLGPNGAGKTTFIKILATLILPDSGTAKIFGYDLITQTQQIKSKVGIVLGEEKGFYWRLTGRQNLEFFGILYELPKAKLRKRIADIANLLEIDDLDKPYQTYSTGMKHRFGLARCLIAEPEIIFMDEPTKSLDPKNSHQLRIFIKEKIVRKLGRTIIFTTHQTKEAETLADKIAIMDKGKIRAFGELNEINHRLGLREDAPLEETFLKIMQAEENES